jgi:hypothetical protein
VSGISPGLCLLSLKYSCGFSSIIAYLEYNLSLEGCREVTGQFVSPANPEGNDIFHPLYVEERITLWNGNDDQVFS